MEVELKLLRKRIETLTAERDLYKEKYEQLRQATLPQLLLYNYGFTETEIKILSIFVADRGFFRKDSYDIMYLDQEEIPSKKGMDTWMCKIRKKIKENNFPVSITTAWGVGYQMDKNSLSFLRQFQRSQYVLAERSELLTGGKTH